MASCYVDQAFHQKVFLDECRQKGAELFLKFFLIGTQQTEQTQSEKATRLNLPQMGRPNRDTIFRICHEQGTNLCTHRCEFATCVHSSRNDGFAPTLPTEARTQPTLTGYVSRWTILAAKLEHPNLPPRTLVIVIVHDPTSLLTKQATVVRRKTYLLRV